MQQEHLSKRTSISNHLMTGSMGGNNKRIVINPPSGFYSPKQNSPIWLFKQNKNITSKASSSHNITSKFFQSRRSKQQDEHNYIINNGITHGSIPFTQLSNISLHNGLFILQGILRQCAYVHQLFGHSEFLIQNGLISEKGQVILTQPSHLSVIIKITDETIIVKKIISFVNDICAQKVFDDFFSFYSRTEGKTKCDFKYTLSLIKSYCMCSKITIGEKFNFNQKPSNSFLHPGSLRLSVRAVSSLGHSRSNRSKKRRMTLQGAQLTDDMKRLHTSKSQQRISNKKRNNQKKSLMQRPNKFFKKDMSKSNQISHQFSLKISSNSSTNHAKDSLMSTNFNTSGLKNSQNCLHSNTDMSLTFNGNFMNSSSSNLIKLPSQNQEIKPFLSVNNLFQVQSQCESSDYNAMDSSRKNCQNNTSIEQKIQKQKVEEAYLNNHWTRKFDNLLSTSGGPQMHESFTQGKQQVCQNRYLNPENLGKLARAVVESMISSPLQQQKKKSTYENTN